MTRMDAINLGHRSRQRLRELRRSEHSGPRKRHPGAAGRGGEQVRTGAGGWGATRRIVPGDRSTYKTTYTYIKYLAWPLGEAPPHGDSVGTEATTRLGALAS